MGPAMCYLYSDFIESLIREHICQHADLIQSYTIFSSASHELYIKPLVNLISKKQDATHVIICRFQPETNGI